MTIINKNVELTKMADKVLKINNNRMYTNVMLQHATQVYEKAKLLQEAEIQEVTKIADVK